jgi:hypothetical protein
MSDWRGGATMLPMHAAALATLRALCLKVESKGLVTLSEHPCGDSRPSRALIQGVGIDFHPDA